MSIRVVSASIAAAAAASFIGSALAHPDDPKIRDRQPRYEGPGWTASQGGEPAIGFPASNVTLRAWLPLTAFGSQITSGNVVWHYVSPSGREYALFGHSHGTAVVEVTNPDAPVIVGQVTGPNSLWRDIRVYQDHCYAVSEGGSGVQVISLANVDQGQVTLVNTITTGPSPAATHTVFINEASGYLYRSGGGSNGLRIYSLANPSNPVYVSSWTNRYCHEVTVHSYTSGPYAGREIAFVCGGFNGGFTNTGLVVVDVTDKQNLVILDEIQYPNGQFCHQGWLSNDLKYFYINDELDEDNLGIPCSTIIINVENLTNLSFAGSFTNNNTAIGHNLYIRGDLLYEANYRSGLRVFDLSANPLNPPEVAYFDTWEQDDGAAFNGLWLCNPYLPSGIVLGSDIEKGLFVWSIGLPLISVSLPDGAPEYLAPSGDAVRVQIEESQPGALQPGSAKLFYRAGLSGNYVESPLVPVSGDLYDAVFPPIGCQTAVSYYITATDTNGVPITIPPGAPGTGTFNALSAFGATTALSDEMETDQGWTVGAPGDNAITGIWVRVDPNGTAAQPEDDHTPQPGVNAWVTGQGSPGGALGDNDVDGGTTTLTSPTMSAVAEEGDAYLEYYRWYSNNTGAAPNSDSMPISISNNNGFSWVQLELVTENAGQWVKKSFRIADFVAPSAQMKVRLQASDLGAGSIVEAGIDDLRIFHVDCTPPPPDLPGDLDGDCDVDSVDLNIVLTDFGCTTPPGGCSADVDGDGDTDSVDLNIVLTSFGSVCP